MGNKHTIELNGKVYDALTGKLIKSAPPAGKSSSPKASDGLIKAASHTKQPAKPVKKPVQPKSKRPTAQQHQGHQPARSTTLMRAGVKKPGHTKKPIDQISAKSVPKPAKHVGSQPSLAHLDINERRLAKAKQTAHSPAVSRFKPIAADQFTTRLEPITPKKPSSTAGSVKKSTAPTKTVKATMGSRLDNILSTGLAKASSHEQPKPTLKAKRKSIGMFKSKWFWLIAIIVIILIAGGIVLSYFAPKIEFDVATTRSGVNINMPSYTPAGFSIVSPIYYASGTITINYADKTTSQQFNIVAQNSDWDSQTLLDSFVIENDPNYQTLQRGGRTFYVYQQTNVTWVNGGVWYRLSAGAGLTTNQLVAIAASL